MKHKQGAEIIIEWKWFADDAHKHAKTTHSLGSSRATPAFEFIGAGSTNFSTNSTTSLQSNQGIPSHLCALSSKKRHINLVCTLNDKILVVEQKFRP
jgi:hypothetical protein